MNQAIYPRHVEPRLRESLGGSPVVFIHGPRQRGKTTFAQAVGKSAGYHHFTLGSAVLYNGDSILGFGESLYALPVRLLWGTT